MTTYIKKQIKGATMIEYVLIIGLIAALASVAVLDSGKSVSTAFLNMMVVLDKAGG